MQFTPASTGSVVAFAAICLYVIGALLAGVYRSSTKLGGPAAKRTLLVGLGVMGWLGLDALVVQSGWAAVQPMPRIMIFLGANNLLVLAFALSPAGAWLARGLSPVMLIGFQAFRLPLELVLHSWVEQGTIPETMTWTGQNYDIASGVLALVAIFTGKRWPVTIRIANVVGLALLANVARVAILSSPLPFAWPIDPPLLIGFHLPYALIVPVCVGGALAGHVILIRALLIARARAR